MQEDLSLSHLLVCALYSTSRTITAYLMALGFTLVVGYALARSRLARRITLPLITLGQCVPSIGIFAGLSLSLSMLFPSHDVGLEISCILMMFTYQVWNLTLSFYSSLKAIPSSLMELAAATGMSRFQRFYKIELPAAMTGLAWSSMLSLAGGWFFATAIEEFTAGGRDFRVPGLRTYILVAAERGDYKAQAAALLAMFAIILFMDFIVWRPAIAFARRFRLEAEVGFEPKLPWVSRWLRNSRFFAFLWRRTKQGFSFLFRLIPAEPVSQEMATRLKDLLLLPFLFLTLILLVFCINGFYHLIRPLRWADLLLILRASGATGLRVILALSLATLWTVPIAIGIGLSPRATRLLQPVIQWGASYPTSMLFPLLIVWMGRWGLSFNIGAAILLLISVQWNVLFNILTGATALSQELRESFALMRVPAIRKWKEYYLPSILPSLSTGWISASRRAWNASVVTEYFALQDRTITAFGLGSLIRDSAARGNLAIFSMSVFILGSLIFAMNHVLLRRIQNTFHARYRFEV